jgi:ATP-dependent RNA helicase DHX8/PRP22
MISATQNVFHRPRDKQQQADQKKQKFNDPSGDHITLLNVYNGWKAGGFSTPWCHENFVMPRNMQRVRDVRTQLLQIMARHKHAVVSCGRNTIKVRQALCSGFFRNSARKDPAEGYKTLVEGTPAPTFFKVAPTDRLSKRKKAERIQPLHNKFQGEDDWRLSSQRKAGRGGGGTWG